MADDIFERIDNKNIELLNGIDYPTINEQAPIVYIYKSKFCEYELIKIVNVQFEIIPKSRKKKKEDKQNCSINNLSKKRGREPTNKCKKGRKNSHDRMCPCNIRTKITIAYISFLEQYINSAVDFFLGNEFNINQYKIKKVFHPKNINKKLIQDFKKQTIKDIISNKISPKYLSSEKNKNEKVCQTIIKKNKELEIILNQKYMAFFKDIFYDSQREVNLTKYGINKTLFLNSNVILYKNLINNIKEQGGNDLDNYLKKMDDVIEEYLKL